jgi:hypothetical protein
MGHSPKLKECDSQIEHWSKIKVQLRSISKNDGYSFEVCEAAGTLFIKLASRLQDFHEARRQLIVLNKRIPRDSGLPLLGNSVAANQWSFYKKAEATLSRLALELRSDYEEITEAWNVFKDSQANQALRRERLDIGNPKNLIAKLSVIEKIESTRPTASVASAREPGKAQQQKATSSAESVQPQESEAAIVAEQEGEYRSTRLKQRNSKVGRKNKYLELEKRIGCYARGTKTNPDPSTEQICIRLDDYIRDGRMGERDRFRPPPSRMFGKEHKWWGQGLSHRNGRCGAGIDTAAEYQSIGLGVDVFCCQHGCRSEGECHQDESFRHKIGPP